MATVVRPKRVREWDVDQSKHEHLPKVPFRMIIAGPSGTGKTQLIQAMILDFYRTKGGKSVFARVYVFSPSVHADPVWGPVRKFCEKELGQDQKKEPFLFDHYNPSELREVIETQKRVIAAGKQQEDLKKLWSILDRGRRFCRQPGLLQAGAAAARALHPGQACQDHHQSSPRRSTRPWPTSSG